MSTSHFFYWVLLSTSWKMVRLEKEVRRKNQMLTVLKPANTERWTDRARHECISASFISTGETQTAKTFPFCAKFSRIPFLTSQKLLTVVLEPYNQRFSRLFTIAFKPYVIESKRMLQFILTCKHSSALTRRGTPSWISLLLMLHMPRSAP